MISFESGILLAANSAAGNVLNRSSRADMISVGAVIFSNGNSCRLGVLSTLMPGNRSDRGAIALTMLITRSCSTLGEATTNSGRTPTNRISKDGATFSAVHQAKSAPLFTSQNVNLLPRLASAETGLVGE